MMRYGGSIENRARLLLQIVDAFIEVWGAGRVGVHLAPRGDSHDMGDDNPLATLVMWLNNWISAMWPLSLPVNMKRKIVYSQTPP